MKSCPFCQHELFEGFDFCHNCGASPKQASEPATQTKHLVEFVDDVKQVADRSAAAGDALGQMATDWLGGSTSIQRRVLYSLTTALAINLYLSKSLIISNFVGWIETWLLTSLLLLPFISYWTTGFIPFAQQLNSLLGEEQSLRRRLELSLLITLPSLSSFLPFLADLLNENANSESFVLGIASCVMVFLISFYFMGYETYWRTVSRLEFSLFRDKMAESVLQVANDIKNGMQKRTIKDLASEEVEMGKLRRLTAGESSGTRGYQLTLTRGRARLVIFVQDFGDSLFIRWAAFYDASGRRLWRILGTFYRAINGIIKRWTGTSLSEYWGELFNILKPASGSEIAMRPGRGGLAALLGGQEGISEYGWNELYALESAVKETIIQVIQRAQLDHQQEDEIRDEVARCSRDEISATSAR